MNFQDINWPMHLAQCILPSPSISPSPMSASHNLEGEEFSGLLGILESASAAGEHPDVLADIEGEQETMPADAEADTSDDEDEDEIDQEDLGGVLPAQWKETMAHASKGVTDNTHREYLRYVLSYLRCTSIANITIV